MKRVIAIISLVAIALPAGAQERIEGPNLDSLEWVVREGEAYVERTDALGELSYYYSFPYRDTVRALAYARQILAINRAEGDRTGLGIGYFHAGGVYLEYDTERAEKAYERAIELLEDDTTDRGKSVLARAWFNLGLLHQMRDEEEEFLDIVLNKTIPLREALEDTMRLGSDYLTVGLIFRNQVQYERALEYDERAIDLLKDYPGYEALPNAYIEAAYSILSIEEEQDFSRKEPLDKARSYLDEAAHLLEPNPDSWYWLSFYEANGVYYEGALNGYEAALDNYTRGIVLAERLGDTRKAMALRTQRYYVYMETGDYWRARADILIQYETFFEQLALKDKVLTLKNLIAAEEKLDNTTATSNLYPQYAALLDSLRREEMGVRISELEQQYDRAEKEREILERENRINRQAIVLRTRLLWILGLAVVALLLGAGFVLVRRRQKMARQEAELLGVKMDRLEKEQEVKMFSAMLEGQERERRRLAADLHDGLGGSLSGIKMKVSRLAHARETTSTSEEGDLTGVLQNLDDSVSELRRIARNMMPASLQNHGLAASLKDFCEGLETEQTRIVLQTFGLRDDIPPEKSLVVYRIIQELVNNAVKHAEASEILVQVMQDLPALDEARQAGGASLSLTVEDDGKGFDTESIQDKPGIGLSSVKARVDYLKGTMDVTSEPGAGTSIAIEINLDDA